MKIETKYDLNQEVWIMDGSRPMAWPIRKIYIDIVGGTATIYYYMNIGVLWRNGQEKDVFPDKESLLKSL